MDLREFLRQLAFYFSLDRKGDEAIQLFEIYVEDILEETTQNKWKGYECDYDQLCKNIRRNYQYKKFPTVAEIISFIPEAMKPIPRQTSYSGREGEVVKRMINGIEYEFTIVPNHWTGVKTIEQLDKDILWRAS